MKRKALVVLMLLSIMLCGCGGNEAEVAEAVHICTHNFVGEECGTYTVCSICGVDGEMVEHKEDEWGICTVCNEDVGILLTDDNVEEYLELVGFQARTNWNTGNVDYAYQVASRSSNYTFENVVVSMGCLFLDNERGLNTRFKLGSATLDEYGNGFDQGSRSGKEASDFFLLLYSNDGNPRVHIAGAGQNSSNAVVEEIADPTQPCSGNEYGFHFPDYYTKLCTYCNSRLMVDTEDILNYLELDMSGLPDCFYVITKEGYCPDILFVNLYGIDEEGNKVFLHELLLQDTYEWCANAAVSWVSRYHEGFASYELEYKSGGMYVRGKEIE